jgi:hypothetical protein
LGVLCSAANVRGLAAELSSAAQFAIVGCRVVDAAGLAAGCLGVGTLKNLSAGNPCGARRGTLIAVALLMVLGGYSAPAGAAPRRISCDSDPECVRLRDEAKRLYDEDKFQLAMSALMSAYVLKADSALLLNMGLTLIGLGRSQEALERCQQFELRVPKRSDQEDQLLALCKRNAQRLDEESAAKAKEAKEAEETKAKAAAVTAATEAAAAEKEKEAREKRARPVYKRAWFWGVIGGVVAAGVIAGVTAGVVTSPAYRVPSDLEVFQVQLRFKL